jgi:homoserine dehydrogenase
MIEQGPINLIILGFGKIGQELTRQVQLTAEKTGRNHPELRLIALADSWAFIHRESGLTPSKIQAANSLKQQGASLQKMDGALPLDQISSLFSANTILVDTTASSKTLPTLLHAATQKSGIVLANKIPLCQPWPNVRSLFSYPLLKYEATVGAGLPVISTLKYLLDTGDTLESITGCLSGTLGYLCSRLEEGACFSQAVRDAHQLGYTEPDPRQDLGGMDVARKAVILSRTAGIPAEISELTVEPLFSPDLDHLSIERFLEEINQEDTRYAKMIEKAVMDNKVPRYTASITPEGIQIGLTLVEKTGSLGSLKGPDNFVSFRTQRYTPSPLIISGPGAGVAVTAAGVFGDIIELGRVMVKGGQA